MARLFPVHWNSASSDMRNSREDHPEAVVIDLRRRWPAAVATVAAGGQLWIAWPKRTSALAGDLGADQVRSFGLRHGWVDFKIAAIDPTWAGLCFSRRKTTPAGKAGGRLRAGTAEERDRTPTASRGTSSRPRRKR